MVPAAPAPARAAEPWALARFERWFLRGGAFALPLLLWWSTYDQYVLPKLLLARFLLLGLAALFVVRVLATGALTVKRTPLDLPILAFLATAGLSTAFAINVNVAVFGIYSRYDGLLTLITYAGLYWFTVQALAGPAEARGLLRTLIAAGYAVAALAVVQTIGDSLQPGLVARAYGTLGQWNVLGAFLAMLLPLAYRELVDAESAGGRLLAANALVVLGLALLLSLSRSGWIGALAGLVVLVAAGRSGRGRLRGALLVVGIVAVLAVATVLAAGAGFPLARSVETRAMTLASPSDWEPRPAIWRATVPLILSRPIAGYGPDSFGLVFPQFNPVYYLLPVDKAHAETLQIAATQGLLGLAAYLWMLAATARAFWRGRALAGASALFAGWLGYEVTLQVNFTALAAALPFWLFVAAAMVSWDAVATGSFAVVHRRRAASVGAALLAGLAALAGVGVVLPYLADASLLDAVDADISGRLHEAQAAATQAHALAPQESVYAVEVGNVAFEQGDWAAARAAYRQAAELGTYNAAVYRNLALADRNLGLLSEARTAALGAYYLNPFDPANRALLAEFGGPGA